MKDWGKDYSYEFSPEERKDWVGTLSPEGERKKRVGTFSPEGGIKDWVGYFSLK